MPVAVPGPNPLWAFLWGKRRSRRNPLALRAHLEGSFGSPQVETVDLSRHGVLLRLKAEHLAGRSVAADALDLLSVPRLLEGGFSVRFPDQEVALRARLVRVSWMPGEADGIYLGCEFTEPLGTRRLDRLGVKPEACGPEAGAQTPPAELMDFIPDPRCPLGLALLTAGGLAEAEGPLLGVHQSALATRLGTTDPTDVVARLSRKAHGVAVSGPDGRVWQGEGYLLAVRVLEDHPGGIEVVLAASPAPGASVTSRMLRRA